MTDKRREARFSARIIARVLRKDGAIELLTNDVSYRGVFIRTDSPPALRQLVKFELCLPGGRTVGGHAMVVHVTGAVSGAARGEGVVPGIGLQFWGPLEGAREWERFIYELRTRERAGMPAAKATDKIRRASERFKLALQVTLDGRQVMTRDVSENGMAVRTEMAIPVGTRVELELRTADEATRFDVVVRRAITEPGFRGLGVEMIDMTRAQHAALVRLVRGSTPREERVFVEPGDPKLH